MKSIDKDMTEAIGRMLDRPVVLVGLMGAGKSKIGYTLAKALGLPFVDADDEIERAAGMSISDIFSKFGEEYFRDGERRVMKRLIDGEPKIIASGGGAVMNPETAAVVREQAVSIWIRADIELIIERIQNVEKRPMLKNGDPAEILRTLAEKRYPVYQTADITVDSHGGPLESVLNQAVEKLYTHLRARADRKAV